MARTEVNTENLFRQQLIQKGYLSEQAGAASKITVDQQSCSLASVADLLQTSSKNGTGRPGYPDFIITNYKYPDMVILVECKASNADHDKAAEEVAGYAYNLVGKYNVVIMAVSGITNETFKITTGIIRKDKTTVGAQTPGYNGTALLTLDEYQKWIEKTDAIENKVIDGLTTLKQRINEVLYETNINSDKRMLLLSACLIGLRNRKFRNSFYLQEDKNLLDDLLLAVKQMLQDYALQADKITTMISNFETLKQVSNLKRRILISRDTTYVNYLKEENPIRYILNKIHGSSIHDTLEDGISNIDIMGEFYSEFITHNNDMGNAKAGFVLTPRHICELFAQLAELDENTKILDMCFGTGGFLVAALQKEIIAAKGDKDKIQNIKNNNICGVELDGDRYTYGCVNMILRGDGHSNMVQGDCFDEKVKAEMKSKHCTVGFINPPYAVQDHKELEFVDNMLNCLESGGTGIAIIPLNCGKNTYRYNMELKERILSKHTLRAVLSMPAQLFYPIANVGTCIMIFTAGKPHPATYKTWFASCKDDGLVLKKNIGRTDINNKWEGIKNQWRDAYLNNESIDGFSLKQHVTADDEWSYEAYAKTNFEGITEESFKRVIKDYALFLLSQSEI